MNIREKTCCFTGHRAIPNKELSRIEAKLEETIIGLINKGYRYFGAGGALGFDTCAALIVLKLKEKYPHIRLILVLPCPDQAAKWKAKDVEVYESIKRNADKIVYMSKSYSADCMHKRNRHLVEHSSVCVCYLTGSKGGTAYTVRYAKSNNLNIINVANK